MPFVDRMFGEQMKCKLSFFGAPHWALRALAPSPTPDEQTLP